MNAWCIKLDWSADLINLCVVTRASTKKQPTCSMMLLVFVRRASEQTTQRSVYHYFLEQSQVHSYEQLLQVNLRPVGLGRCVLFLTIARSFVFFMPLPVISCQRHTVRGLSTCRCMIIYQKSVNLILTSHLWEFHQIYNFRCSWHGGRNVWIKSIAFRIMQSFWSFDHSLEALTPARVGPGHPSFPPCPFASSSFPLLLFPFFHWLYLFSSSFDPFPFYQNSPTSLPGRRS